MRLDTLDTSWIPRLDTSNAGKSRGLDTLDTFPHVQTHCVCAHANVVHIGIQGIQGIQKAQKAAGFRAGHLLDTSGRGIQRTGECDDGASSRVAFRVRHGRQTGLVGCRVRADMAHAIRSKRTRPECSLRRTTFSVCGSLWSRGQQGLGSFIRRQFRGYDGSCLVQGYCQFHGPDDQSRPGVDQFASWAQLSHVGQPHPERRHLDRETRDGRARCVQVRWGAPERQDVAPTAHQRGASHG